MDFTSLQNCRYTVIGDPVAHSRSPEMQNAGFEALGMGSIYGKLHVKAEELAEFADFARTNLDGFNITVPHKERIIPLLDEIDPVAEAAGSVNTVSCREGKLSGTSTDGYGLEMAIKEAFDFDLSGKNVLFLGTGGVTHATAFHFASRKAGSLMLVNRTLAKAEKLALRLLNAFPGLPLEVAEAGHDCAIAEMVKKADILIQSTSLGLHESDPMPLNPELLEINPNLCIFDTIYRPTPLLEAARGRGLRCADGRWMLLHQGVRSMEIWTAKTAPVEIMREALQRSLTV